MDYPSFAQGLNDKKSKAMKNLKPILLLAGIMLFGQLGDAQIVDQPKRFEISTGLNKTKKYLKLSGSTGFWITTHFMTQLFFLSPQGRTILFEPSDLSLEGGRMEKASIKLGGITGLNFRIYHKSQSGLFAGLGLTHQRYLITAKSVFDNDPNIRTNNGWSYLLLAILAGGDHVVKAETSANTWGLNWQLGYAFPTKNGRFEILFRQNNPFIQNHQYSYLTSRNSNETKTRSVKSDFGLFPLSFEMNYVFDLF